MCHHANIPANERECLRFQASGGFNEAIFHNYALPVTFYMPLSAGIQLI